MKHFFLILYLTAASLTLVAQKVQYKYDKAGRLIQAVYPDQKAINYNYDKDGNRASTVISTVIITSVNNLNDSLYLMKEGVFIYPNPSDGNFRAKIYSSMRQEVTIEIFTAGGQLVHTYNATVNKGFFVISINIAPKPVGIYILHVKGKSLNASKQVVIVN